MWGKKTHTHRKVTPQFKGQSVREREAENPRSFAALRAQRWRNFNIIRLSRLLECSSPSVASRPSTGWAWPPAPLTARSGLSQTGLGFRKSLCPLGRCTNLKVKISFRI